MEKIDRMMKGREQCEQLNCGGQMTSEQCRAGNFAKGR
jgi:hypothetical protein